METYELLGSLLTAGLEIASAMSRPEEFELEFGQKTADKATRFSRCFRLRVLVARAHGLVTPLHYFPRF